VTMRGSGYGNKVTLEQFFAALPSGVEPVGRLDRMTTGLMLLTNDGDLNHAVLKKGTVEKEYHLLLWAAHIQLADPRLQELLRGIVLADGPARASEIKILDVLRAVAYCPQQFQKHDTGGLSKAQQKKLAKMQRNKRSNPLEEKDFELLTDEEIRSKWSLISVTIAEGRNRIVRRMAKAVGLILVHLHRARFGSLVLAVPNDKRQKCEVSSPEDVVAKDIVCLQAGAHCALSEEQREALTTASEVPGDYKQRALKAWVYRTRYFRKQGRPNERLERFFESNGINLASIEVDEPTDEDVEDDQDDL